MNALSGLSGLSALIRESGGYAGIPALLPGLVAHYAFAEGSGQHVFNKANNSPVADTNLLGSPEPNHSTLGQSPWSVLGITITDHYAPNPLDGEQTAARLVMTAGGSKYFLQNVNVPADGDYVLSVYAKSNTGSAQKVRLSLDNTGTLSADQTLPADGSWVRLSRTQFLAAGTTGRAPIASASDNSALDIVIYGCKFEPGTTPTPYLPPVFDLTLGKTGGVDGSDPIWSGVGLSTAEGTYLQGYRSAGAVLGQCAIYVAARRTGTIDNTGYVPLLIDSYDRAQLRMLLADGGNAPRFALNGGGVQAVAADLLAVGGDGGWHVWTGVYDGTTISLYLDDVLIARATGPITPYTLRHLILASANGAGYLVGDYGAVLVYDQGHNAAQRAQIRTYVHGLLTARGQSYSPTLQDLVCFEGDSITAGTSLRQQYPYLALNGLNPVRNGRNFAVAGSTLSDLNSRAAGVDALYDPSRRRNILFVLEGKNDLLGLGAATWESTFQAYCQARRAAGWKVIVATLLPSTDVGFNAARNPANTWLRANWGDFADALCDFAADPTMGPEAAAGNDSLYSDGTHPTAAGEALLAPIARTALAGVLA